MTNRNAFAMVTTRDSLTLTDEPSRFDFPAICALIPDSEVRQRF